MHYDFLCAGAPLHAGVFILFSTLPLTQPPQSTTSVMSQRGQSCCRFNDFRNRNSDLWTHWHHPSIHPSILCNCVSSLWFQGSWSLSQLTEQVASSSQGTLTTRLNIINMYMSAKSLVQNKLKYQIDTSFFLFSDWLIHNVGQIQFGFCEQKQRD